MFAVKGWNVDASALKPQTEVFKKPTAPNEDGEQRASRKRKRENAESAKESAEKDKVGQQWEEHIEGKQQKSKKELKKERKRQKLAQEDGKQESAPEKTKPVKTKLESADTEMAEKQVDAGAEKKPKKNKKKDRKPEQNDDAVKPDQKKDNAVQNAAPAKPPPLPAGMKLTPMQAKMREKLTSARFRHLNETLYTAPSEKALELFDKNPEMFEDYHSGFRQQVTTWPENPVDNFIATIRARGKVRLQSQKKAFKNNKKRPSGAAEEEESATGKLAALPRTHGTAIIADLGCGDARLAQTLKDSGDGQKLQLKVLSYDLHSPSPLVTKADISNIPTPDGSVDIAIFCLALMGTNWISFIEEAYRILHWKGELWVAEIKSRFGRVGRAGKPVEHSVGGKRKLAAMKKAQEKKAQEQEEINEQETLAVAVDGVETKNQETDVSAFVDVLRRRGFVLKDGDNSIDLSNKMFVKMEFIKAAPPVKGKNKPEESAKDSGEKKGGFVKKESWKKSKFLDEENKDDVATDDEAKTLKPCLYKIR
ncbi:25S rRNA (adenine-N(1))-methyltransferase [Pseudocercospora fuligena]|uniref:Ribosomal RNA-processing protein 8 n=1 Tax=Pseudocercospora fuligena TaxID=685502 RepID=A0A8H6VCV4_9PEZI|nr:25S rRNA (adenine-N(1))-methyltransferase [Pseudocercospora fuligena]